MPSFYVSSLETAAKALSEAKSLVVLTGAGISAESGIPTFRGEDGLWRQYRPEELASPAAFERDPKLVWEWYNWRKNLISSKEPNPAHYAITRLEKVKDNSITITQNVDDLHRKAGTENLIEMHGNIFRARCLKCGKKQDCLQTSSTSPECMHCGGRLRPDIVWFGEMLDSVVVSKIEAALFDGDVLFIIGTSGVVYPAAGFADSFLRKGKTVIEVNIEQAREKSSSQYIHINGKAAEILPKIIEKMKN